MSGTQQGWRSTSGGGSPSSDITIQNTLYVMKNGDDSTALPNRLDKPFLTIYEASLQAVAGDVIYVFAGDYDEANNDWVQSDVIYDFQEGANVTNVDSCISDGGIAKNIHIQGNGNFIQSGSDFSKAVVYITKEGSNLYLRCNNIIANTNGIGIFNIDNPYDIKVKTITVSLQYAINLRGSVNHGSIEFNEIISTSRSVSILFRSCNTDNEERNVYIKGKYIKTNQNAFNQGVIDFISAFSTKAYITVTKIEHYAGSLGGIVRGDSGLCFLSDTNAVGVGYGYQSTGSHIGLVLNCNIKAVSTGIYILRQSSINCINTLVIAQSTVNRQATVVVNNESGELTAKNCTFVQLGANDKVSVVSLEALRSQINFASCVFIGNVLNVESIRNSKLAPANIYIQEDCSANLPVSTFITNQITGTNIVVDSDIIQNTNNFF